ncbi:MAG: hypothetical protein ACYC6Y_31045, partial [Thermoguttaceae bacterium]
MTKEVLSLACQVVGCMFGMLIRPGKIVMFGSSMGKRPVLTLSKDAKGFADPAKPKIAVWIWAQTRDDAPGKQEPEWGKEQPNISLGPDKSAIPSSRIVALFVREAEGGSDEK